MRWAEHCFDSLQNSSVVPDIFVIDNGSTDETQAYIKENYPNVLLVQSEKNLGFGAANNIGLKYALENNYDYIYLLNQDAWVMSDTFEKLIKISQDNPEFGLISPIQMNADLYHIDKNFCTGLFDYQNKDVINDLYNNKLKDIYETTPFVMAAHWFLTRRCIEKIGGFSPTFRHYGEDNNYAHRIIYHNFKIGVVPSLKVVHDRGERVDAPKKLMYLYYTSFLVALSNPSLDNNFHLIIKSATISSMLTLKYKSLIPIMYFFKLILNITKLLKNKKMTRKQGSLFL